jgi:hypothetical protein
VEGRGLIIALISRRWRMAAGKSSKSTSPSQLLPWSLCHFFLADGRPSFDNILDRYDPNTPSIGGKVESTISVLKRLIPLLLQLSVSPLPLCSHKQSTWIPPLGPAAPPVSWTWMPCLAAIRGPEIALISLAFTLALLGRGRCRILLRPASSPLGSLTGRFPPADKHAHPCLATWTLGRPLLRPSCSFAA